MKYLLYQVCSGIVRIELSSSTSTSSIPEQTFWFWFSNQQDSFTNEIADGSAWGLM